MRVVVLTSSRADYGIYLPLLKKLQADPFFELKLIVFGTHLSVFHGYTKNAILKDGFEIYKEVESLVLGDSAEAISTAMGLTQLKFSSVWENEKDKTDLIFCLGDRYEMLSAVLASVPFNISIAHIHGGETTLGAIDNLFRHSLTLASKYHFASTEKHAERISELIGNKHNIYNVGALSLDNIKEIELYSIAEFKELFGVDLSKPTVLVTFHPETVAVEKNIEYVRELEKALEQIPEQVLITMPNADTMGNIIRKKLEGFIVENKGKVFGVESLGTRGYFSALHYCEFLIGNSSSGIIEAASFKKYVINIGDRQKGRASGDNVFHCSVDAKQILDNIARVRSLPEPDGINMYGDGNATDKIIEVLKKEFSA